MGAGARSRRFGGSPLAVFPLADDRLVPGPAVEAVGEDPVDRILLRGDELWMYYGAADSYVCLATARLDDVLAVLST